MDRPLIFAVGQIHNRYADNPQSTIDNPQSYQLHCPRRVGNASASASRRRNSARAIS